VAILKQIATFPKTDMCPTSDVEAWFRGCQGERRVYGTLSGIAASDSWFAVLMWDGHSFEEFQEAYARMLLEAASTADLSKVMVLYYSPNGEDLHA
jgi:hypothetical protein